MRSINEVLGREEEKQNLRSGAVAIAAICAMVVMIFALLNLNLGVDPKVGSEVVVQVSDTEY